MSVHPQRRPWWFALPIIGFIISEWQVWHAEQARPCFNLAPASYNGTELPPYPLEMDPLLALPHGVLDEVGVPYNSATNKYPAGYQPTTIAEYGLANWNAYLRTGEDRYKRAFLTQACWLMAHETRFADDAGGWYLPMPIPDYAIEGPWLSAMTQGNAISVLVRAYRLTNDEAFLAVARRAIRLFERDVRDGGVSVLVGEDGVFFEEVAAYPASHILNGYLFALFGLYDYIAQTHDAHIATLIQRSLVTLHTLIDRYDMGYWSYYDLFRKPATKFYHALHVIMLQALSRYSGCEHCRALAARWAGYQQSHRDQVRYLIASRFARYRRGLQRLLGCKPYLSPAR